MNNNQSYNSREVKGDEVDLGKAFMNAGGFFRRLVEGAVNLTISFKDNLLKNYKLVLAIILAGAALGAFRFYLIRPFYSSSITVYSEYFKGEILDNTVKNLNTVCEEGNYKLLSKLLLLPESQTQNIKALKVRNIIPQPYKKLLELNQDDERLQNKLDSILLYHDQSTFEIYTEVYDTSAFGGLEEAIINYIKKNEYVQRRIEIDRANMRRLKTKIEQELPKFDTLKLAVYKNISTYAERARSGSNNIILADQNTANPLDVFKQDFDLYQQGLNLERDLFLKKEIEIVEGFIPSSRPVSGSFIYNLIKGLALAFAIVAVIIGIITIRGALAAKVKTEAYVRERRAFQRL